MGKLRSRSPLAAATLVGALLVSGCGGGSDSTGLSGGATFSGTFAVGPGVGPGAISFVVDDDGTRIVTAMIDPGLDEFACPTGVRISGGGLEATYTPGIDIKNDAFESRGWSGIFDSSTEARGTYDLQDSFDCPFEVAWTATRD